MRLNGSTEDSGEVGDIYFRSSVCVIGQLHVDAATQSFSTTNRVRGFVLAFPRTTSKVIKEGHDPFIASPSTVSFYNAGQEYLREKVSDEGDHTDWIAFDPSLLREIIAEFDPAVDERSQRLLRHAWAPTDPRLYVEQRLVSARVASDDPADPLQIEERVISIARRTIGDSYRWRQERSRTRHVAGECDDGARIDRVLRRIAQDYHTPLSLTRLAREAEVSVYHLCRIFRKATGSGVHRHLVQQRLRAALALMQRERDLTHVALETGFSSHAHFTAAFRASFGMSPTQFRASGSTPNLAPSQPRSAPHRRRT